VLVVGQVSVGRLCLVIDGIGAIAWHLLDRRYGTGILFYYAQGRFTLI
jgi:hypothetical protein